jgi:murein DD-endopeptidase MepM/ murein hydrolase activator NlpD
MVMNGRYNIDRGFYIGKENIFPTQYTGYHSGTDLEILPGEENILVPVYAITTGKIIFIGMVSGYGGVILQTLNNNGFTALYGHLKIDTVNLKVGDTVNAGASLAYLGEGFSYQTGGERKHLHLGIYKGSGLYFHGYETNINLLQKLWVDPVQFLKDKSAIDPVPGQIQTSTLLVPVSSSSSSASILSIIVSLLKQIFRF